uniref:Uncharacterized protein n=1 Tax=Rhizophagus irregularis (strain DAOM 181602 / DAOM 197198 / MUCL 43194) TaxID=747089 RepID=U9TJM3_RHIID
MVTCALNDSVTTKKIWLEVITVIRNLLEIEHLRIFHRLANLVLTHTISIFIEDVKN